MVRGEPRKGGTSAVSNAWVGREMIEDEEQPGKPSKPSGLASLAPGNLATDPKARVDGSWAQLAQYG